MTADRIKQLRTSVGMTQSDLARELQITRSCVNAWEMGISTPSTAYLTELSTRFHVSTDYLLGLDRNASLDISGLTEKQIKIVYELIRYFRDIYEK